MKKICAVLLLSAALCVGAGAVAPREYLAKAIAVGTHGEPFVVKVAYGEMLLRRMESELFPDTLPALVYAMRQSDAVRRALPGDADLCAADIAAQNLKFTGGALYVAKWKDVENTPLSMRSGVRFYDWFFYS